jgi:hypothetical protein
VVQTAAKFEPSPSLRIKCGFEDRINWSASEREEVDGGEPMRGAVGKPVGEGDVEIFAVGEGTRLASPIS